MTIFDKALELQNHEILTVLLSSKKLGIGIEEILKCKINVLKDIAKHFGYEISRVKDDNNANDQNY